MVDHEGAERPAHRAGKPAEQREIGDRPARLAAVEPAERGEHRIIEPGAHAEPDQGPAGEIDRQRRRQTDHHQAGGVEQRARQQQRPPAIAVDQPPDRGRDQPGDQEAQRGAADHQSERPAGILDDRPSEHRRKIERGAPGQDLGHAERGDDDAAIERARLGLQ